MHNVFLSYDKLIFWNLHTSQGKVLSEPQQNLQQFLLLLITINGNQKVDIKHVAHDVSIRGVKHKLIQTHTFRDK